MRFLTWILLAGFFLPLAAQEKKNGFEDLRKIKRVRIVNNDYEMDAHWKRSDSSWSFSPVKPLNTLEDSLFEHMLLTHFTRNSHAGMAGATTKFLWVYKGQEELYQIKTLGAVRHGNTQYFAMTIPFVVGIGAGILAATLTKEATTVTTPDTSYTKNSSNGAAVIGSTIGGVLATYWLVNKFYLEPNRATLKIEITKLKH